jgi:hypothetical protein
MRLSRDVKGTVDLSNVRSSGMQALAQIEMLSSNQAGYAQYMRLRQAYIQLTTHQPQSAYKQARRGSLSFAV